jgi:beta-xylosidase
LILLIVAITGGFKMLKREDIYIRDPYIIPVAEEHKYYLFGTTDKNCWRDDIATGFDYYTSYDLKNFEGPFVAFRPDENFWSDKNYWAPEVHAYNGKYYMFATFIADGRNRGTQILCSENIIGPFKTITDGPVTPRDWMCLDGTLYVDENSDPWIIFCHEWVQIYDGDICAMKLSKDMKSAVTKPVALFKASDAPWTKSIRIKDEKECYVTDGPYICKGEDNSLMMLWSSFTSKDNYAIGIARSANGSILGPWTHDEEPLFKKDGGHGMLFKTFEGDLMLTIHTPNTPALERPAFIRIDEEKNKLNIK